MGEKEKKEKKVIEEFSKQFSKPKEEPKTPQPEKEEEK
jgi:hypothetical protein